MKRIYTRGVVLMVLTLIASFTMAQTYTYPVKGRQGFTLTEKTRDGLRISYELGSFSLNQMNYRGEVMSEISIKSIVLPNAAGSPNLPTESRMMAIPQGATATLNVIHAERQVIKNVNIAPALRIQAETEKPEMDYKKDMKIYGRNAFYPENPFEISTSYIRGVDAVTVSITPFQYNPVTKELVVFTDVELSVSYEGGNGHFGEDRLRSPYWDPILAAELMNYDQLPVIDYEARMQQWLRDGTEGAEYLIITPNNDAWAPYAQQLKEYRMKQGILTEVYRLDEMPASTTDAMRLWFHNAYHTWGIAPVAVCLLGDHGTNMSQFIPAEVVFHSNYYGNCITDNRYADAQGNDNLPDMVFSRLVAQNETELPIFISKQIEYEYTNPNIDPSFYTSPVTALGWQTERWFQLCSEVFGGYMRNKGYNTNRINCIYEGTPGNIWSSNQNTDMVVNYFGPNGTNYIPATPSELGNWNNGTPEQVVQAVNNGTFWIQHRDHGLNEGWGEPAVRNPHIDQMNNVGKLPFVMSINCETGMFDYTGSNGNCFTEKWMRRTYNGGNAGAVGVLSPTQVSYSFVNDAYVWGVYDLFDGNFMPDYGPYQPAAPQTGNWMPAFGNVAGKYFLAQSSWPYNVESKDITYTMFTAHCDAFLRIYTQVPQTMAVNHQSVQLAGLTTFQITAPEGTTIALTKGEGTNMEIVAVAQASGSIQNMEIPSQVPPTILRLTVTGQNYLRYEADIEVIPADGPYVIIDEYALSNQATQLNFGEDAGFDLILKNVGNAQAPAGTVTLTCESEYVTITNGTVEFGDLDSNVVSSLDNAFAFSVSDEVPNRTSIQFTVTITSGDDIYESHITLKAYAPAFRIGDVGIREINGNGNGRLDPGETAKLSFTVYNNGNADSHETTATLLMNNVFLQLLGDASQTISGIPASEGTNFEYQVHVGNAPAGYPAEYTLDITSGIYTDSKDFVAKLGLNVEDFEMGVLNEPWTNDLPYPWTFETDDPYEGQYCLKSGVIGNSQETVLTLTYEVGEPDSISFYFKVSSENYYDKLHFYIDNQELNSWSGTIGWTKKQYAVNAGNHSFVWKYIKDGSVDSGSDCCWIDFVELPRDLSLSASAGLDITTCGNEAAHILGYAANYQTLEWTTSGDGSFDDATIAEPIYTPGNQDIANGSVTLTLTATGFQDNTITDEMTVTFSQPVSIENALHDISYCALNEPQSVAVNIIGDYSTFTWSTSGDGIFEDPSALETTYTPGAQDIANGVTLYATAHSEGCGDIVFDYPLEMSPSPFMDMPLPNCFITSCQGEDFTVGFASFSGYVNGQMTMEVNGETLTLTEGQPLVLPTSDLEPGSYTFEFHHLSNGICEIDPNYALGIQILETPQLNVDKTFLEICEGETATFEFTTNDDESMLHSYIIEGEGIEPILFDGSNYSFELTPTETTAIHLTRITLQAGGCGSDCINDLDITLTVNVVPTDEAPAISGDTELDARITPSSSYTITNSIRVDYSLSPEEAGTIEMANDDMTVHIVWNQEFRGQAVLTATSLSECNDTEGNLAITVKNSTGVDELNASAKLYPNPTSDKVNIECEGMTRISVYNTVGQLIYTAEVDADQCSFDLSQHPSGSYLVRIITRQGTVVKKVHKK